MTLLSLSVESNPSPYKTQPMGLVYELMESVRKVTINGEPWFCLKDVCAKAFQKWIYTFVLPSIRKTGSYTLPTVTQTTQSKLDQLLIAVQEMIALEKEDSPKMKTVILLEP